LPAAQKQDFERMVRECRKHGIQFCFSMNPNLRSDRPFDYNNPKDLDALWQHYAWMQRLGVKWFNVSLDDIEQRIDAEGQAKLLNEVLRRLREKDPEAKLIFTPTWYAGPAENKEESSPRLGTGDTPGVRYTKELAEKLDSDVYLFWTGPEVCSLTITAEEAANYARLARHRVFIWDNYPVNDQHSTLHLGPLMGRDARLGQVVDGYIANPLSPQNEANRIPMLTIADYLWNPEAYDPARSIGQAIAHLSRTRAQEMVLKDLVELYPGRLVDGSFSTGWNSLRVRFRGAESKSAELALIGNAEGVSRRMANLFPNQYVLARGTLDADIAGIREEFAKRYPSK
jgi:hyaluronoglucosaminidase